MFTTRCFRLVARLRRSVGRGLDPAVDGCGRRLLCPFPCRSRPVCRGKRHTTHTWTAAAFITPQALFSSGRRPRDTTIFHFYFLIFNFPSLFFVAFLTTPPAATAAALRGAGAAGSLRSPAKWASPVGRRYRRRPGISPARTKRRLQLGSTYYWQGAPP